ncbi:hypothetical protein GW17_00043243 [Ensete ventricosum]|nr:hypothetical protein GW17_00043243 [Ensete ventricosum]
MRRGGQPLCRAVHPRPGRGQGPLQRGGWLRPGPARKGGQRRPQGQKRHPQARSPAASLQGRQPPASTAACSTAPARGCRLWPALAPAGAVTASKQGQSSPTQGQRR